MPVGGGGRRCRVGGGGSERQLWSTAAAGSRRVRAGDPSRSEPLDRIDTARDAESSCRRSVDGIRPCRRRVAHRANALRAHSRRANGRRGDGRRAPPPLRGRGWRRARHRNSGGAPGKRSRSTGQVKWSSGRCRYAHRRLRSSQQERRREPCVPIPRVRDVLISRVHRPDPHAPRLALTAMPMLL